MAMNKSTMIKVENCNEEEKEESIALFLISVALVCLALLSMGFAAGFFYANSDKGEYRRDVASEATITRVMPAYPM